MTSMTPQQLWQAALGELELSLSKANFTTWFKHTFISELEDQKITISVPNLFTKAWLEKKYHSAILKALQNILNTPLREVLYRVDARPQSESTLRASGLPTQAAVAITDVDPAPQALPTPTHAGQEITNEHGLRRQYTFENFVVGKGNELAHAAAQAVAEHPGQKYNPLFLYGGVGLGKTHLMQAIGNAMLARNPETRVRYVTSEQFTNDYINAVRAGHAKEFKDRYRNVDLLILDDIQFMANKEGTQEEFFHTFNALYQEGRQVVVSSDRTPKSIPNLEKRLESRLEMGMVVDISAPDLETRIAILRTKCVEKNWPLPDEILTSIATTVSSNVRELEGALNKIIANLQFHNVAPTIETVKSVLSASFAQSQAKKTVTAKQLIATVCSYYDLSMDDLLGKSREKKLAFPRQILMYLMREEMKASFPTIGMEIGNRDHTTAMHACLKIAGLLGKDDKLQQDLSIIRERIYQV